MQLSESQKAVFRAIADNKAMLACLEEFFEDKFTGQVNTEGITNEEAGAIARAQFEGLKRVRQAFTQIESCRSYDDKMSHINPAR